MIFFLFCLFVLRVLFNDWICFTLYADLIFTRFLRYFNAVQLFNKVCQKNNTQKKTLFTHAHILADWDRWALSRQEPTLLALKAWETSCEQGVLRQFEKSLTFLPGFTLRCVSLFVICPTCLWGPWSKKLKGVEVKFQMSRSIRSPTLMTPFQKCDWVCARSLSALLLFVVKTTNTTV